MRILVLFLHPTGTPARVTTLGLWIGSGLCSAVYLGPGQWRSLCFASVSRMSQNGLFLHFELRCFPRTLGSLCHLWFFGSQMLFEIARAPGQPNFWESAANACNSDPEMQSDLPMPFPARVFRCLCLTRGCKRLGCLLRVDLARSTGCSKNRRWTSYQPHFVACRSQTY